ncbi:phosphonate ABC transporter, permease protein PhnE [Candidatus Bipolaricaulota bacterium]
MIESTEQTGFSRFMKRSLLGLDALIAQFTSLVLDAIVVFYTAIIATYCYSQIVHGEELWLFVPWWLLVIISLEIALLWETFGVSLGMRLGRLRLRSIEDANTRPGLVQRLVRFAAFQLFGFTLLGLLPALWNRQQSTFYDLTSKTVLRKYEDTETVPRSWHRTSTGLMLALLALLTMIAAVYIVEIKIARLFTGAARAVPVFRDLLRPDWTLAGMGLGLLIETLFMSLLATLFGVVVAVPLSFLAARNLTTGPIGRLVYMLVRIIMSITRSVEPLIWAIIFVLWVRLGTFPGMLALWVHSIADLTKLYSERLESIDQGPVEAIRATGASRLQIIVYGIIPQIVNPYLSFTLYRWDINVRMATIIGIVAGGGIGQQLYLYTRYWKWSEAAMLMLLIMATVWVIDYVSARLRARLEAGSTRQKARADSA